MVLPSVNSELKLYISKNKFYLFSGVIASIEYSLQHDLQSVEVFRFVDSDFIITLNEECFLENLEHIYKSCMEHEEFELCSKIKKLNLKLIKKYEKT